MSTKEYSDKAVEINDLNEAAEKELSALQNMRNTLEMSKTSKGI
jgi:hypothetical protein